MFLQIPNIDPYVPFIIGGGLLAIGVVLFKIGLLIVRAEERVSFKWTLSSFFIQFALVLFISIPLAFEKILAMVADIDYEGPQALGAVIVIALSVFIVVNLINAIHKVGIIRSIIVLLFVVGPMTGAIFFIYSGIVM